MSVLPSSAGNLASAILDGHSPAHETFHKFFDYWVVEQNNYLQELISACKNHQNKSAGVQSACDDDQAVLRPLVNLVLKHYEVYYKAKSKWAEKDVLVMLSLSWTSSLEDAFLWIGGWRPTMVFHLLYSKSGLQLETQLSELIRGLGTGDLGDLSPTQLKQIDELQRKTVREEKELTEKLAKHQETVADSSMVELSHEVSELLRREETGYEEEEARVEATLAPKVTGLVQIMKKADDLRLGTMEDVIELLTPIQAVHLLIAAAELHLRLHHWGKKKDDSANRGEQC